MPSWSSLGFIKGVANGPVGDLAQAMEKLGALEVRAQRAVDAAVAGKLKDVIASMNTSPVIEQVQVKKADAVADRQAELRRRATPYLNVAAEVRASLREFDRLYKPSLDAVSEISRAEWLAGTPSEGRGAHAAAAFFAQIANGLAAISSLRESLELTLRTDHVIYRDGSLAGGYAAELERLIAAAAYGWSPEKEREWVWAITRLEMASPDSITTLVLHVKGVVGAAQRLKDLRSAENVSVSVSVPLYDDTRTIHQKQQAGDAPVANANWDVFGGDR